MPSFKSKHLKLNIMIHKRLLISLAGLFLLGGVFYFALSVDEPAEYTPRSISNQIASFGFNDAAQWYLNSKRNQVTGQVDHRDMLLARKEVSNVSRAKGGTSVANISWSEVGPNNIAGRTRSLVIDKDNHNILYTAGVSGGIFKSTTAGSSWVRIDDHAENLAVSCMAQCPVTGHIYAGTGEGLASPRANPAGGTAFIGKGIYKSTDGKNFSLLSSTIPTTANSPSAEWATVNEIAIDEQGWIYAATNRGLRLSKDQGQTWENPLHPVQQDATDVNVVKVGNNKTVVAAIGNRCYVSTTGDGNYVNQSTNEPGKLPGSGISRIEFAIAPSNPDIIYAAAADMAGNLYNVYRSQDKGNSWEIIGAGGSTYFEPFRAQGWFNNTLAVFPNNPDRIILGGIDIWSWEEGKQWTQRTLWYLPETSPYYVHADIHRFTFHPTQPNTFYVGSDGGISRSTDGGITYQTINKNLNTIQFYTIATSATGEVIGGTQDNGTIFISRKGNSPMQGRIVRGGDGGYAAISIINPDAMFATSQYAAMGRSFNRGDNFYPTADGTNPFFSERMDDIEAGFVTPFLLWETFEDIYSPDSARFIAIDTSYNAGDVVNVMSKNGYLFEYQLTQPVSEDDTIYVHDQIQSRFLLGVNNGIWMTREALDFSVRPEWFQVASFSGLSQTMSISKCGNHLFVGTHNGRLYRISNLRHAYDYESSDIGSPFNVVETKLITDGLPSNRFPGSIAIDPNDANHVVMTFGNYGNTTYVYRSTNALSSNPTFSPRQGNLPAMPVYASLIEMNNNNIVIVGTEYGTYATDNIQSPQPIWYDVNDGLAHVPVYMIRQQVFDYPGVTNYGVIYAGTHGRGAFESFTFMSTNENMHPTPIATRAIELNVYPNPAIDNVNVAFTLDKPQSAELKVFDLSGRMVDSYNISQTHAGENVFRFSCANYPRGTYIITVQAGKERISSKLIVY